MQNNTLNAEMMDKEAEIYDAEFDAEIASNPPSKKTLKGYIHKLNLLSAIHNEIANMHNALLKTRLDSYRTNDDKFIPYDGNENLVAQMVHVHSQHVTCQLP